MLQKIKKEIKQYNMLKYADGVLVGVSGGADSVCLLLVLCALRQEYHLNIHVLHVHHMLRGAEADEDAAFVQNLCRQQQVACDTVSVDVGRLAKQQQRSVEEVGRDCRYQLFEEYRARCQLQKIAVAHHRDDNAETVLFQMLRGTGLTGLAGMRRVRADGVIRPLLSCSRSEIEQWLITQGQSWRVDSTNLLREYARNKIRLDLLPVIENSFGLGAVQQLTNQCEVYREMDDYFNQQAKSFLDVFWEEAQMRLNQVEFLAQPRPIQRYIALQCLEKARGKRKDLGHIHVDTFLELAQKQTGARRDFPYGLEVFVQYGYLYFVRKKAQEGEKEEIPYKIQMKTTQERKNFQESSCTKCFDYDRIQGAVVLRTRQAGDWMQLYADGRKKKLKDIFIDLKIPRQQRDAIPLVAVGNEILWIVGYRTTQAYRVEEETKWILEVKITEKEGTEDGGKN